MPRPVIIDTDPGTDDALALFLALASPEFEIRAITVSGGNVGLDRTLANALALKRLAGATVPVFAGADRPLFGAYRDADYVHGEDGLGGIALPPGDAAAPGIAADAMRAVIRHSTEKVTLIGIGPATNLALALATEPALAAGIDEIVLMSGAWNGGNVTSEAEFNAWSDPEALEIVLGAGVKVTFATLELTEQALVTPARTAALREQGHGQCLRVACDILARMPAGRLRGGAPLHDPCAIAWLIRPDLFTSRPATVRMALGSELTRGRTVIDRGPRAGRTPNALVLETLDADGFFALLGERLAQLP